MYDFEATLKTIQQQKLSQYADNVANHGEEEALEELKGFCSGIDDVIKKIGKADTNWKLIRITKSKELSLVMEDPYYEELGGEELWVIGVGPTLKKIGIFQNPERRGVCVLTKDSIRKTMDKKKKEIGVLRKGLNLVNAWNINGDSLED